MRRPGSRSRRPITARSGWWASGSSYSSRTVSSGSSTSTVPVPTSITSHCARSRCASTRAAWEVTQRLRPVGGGAAAVEGGGELPGDERPVVLHAEGPGPVQRPRLALHQAERDLDARRAQRGLAAGGDRVGVGLREHDARDAGLDHRLGARSGASGVVAGLERDDRRGPAGVGPRLGERGRLGVRAPRAAVVPLRDLGPVGVQQDAADPRVRAQRDAGRARELERATHRPLLASAELHLASPDRPLTDSGARARRPGTPAARLVRASSHPDFDRRSRSSTWSTGRSPPGDGVRPGRGLLSDRADFHSVTAGAEFHRPQSTRAFLLVSPSLPHPDQRGGVKRLTPGPVGCSALTDRSVKRGL